jgi:two-component system nitrogen regulation response regulator GlnG
MPTILVIDDEPNIIKSFQSLLSPDHEVHGATNRQKAMDFVRENRTDFVFLDYNLGGDNGLDLMSEIQAIQPDLDIAIISGQGDFELIINAMAQGSFDYLEKPLDIDKIQFLLKRAMKSKKLSRVVNLITDEQSSHYNLNRIIGKSLPMQEVFKKIGLLLNQDVSVLITGENGTGKELIARALHHNSERKEEPFVAVNCSGLSESLLENELFGHEKQAYTGAVSRVLGKFEAAGEGTIFLDEIGEMPSTLQAKLLRVLQEREFHRLGGNRAIQLKARIIAATNVNIEREVEEGRFRRDLFYRVNVARIAVPSLRERKEDIPLLLNHFLQEANRKLNRKIEGATKGALRKLLNQNWPGNVRELENTIINTCINTHGTVIRSSSIPERTLELENSDDDKDSLDMSITRYMEEVDSQDNLLAPLIERVESIMINQLADKYDGNKSRIAAAMGISRVTLAKKMALMDL